MVKRFFDISVLVVLSPLILVCFLLIALAIKLDSRGPVLFRQKRLGRYNRPFIMHKFRTMTVDAPRLHVSLSKKNRADGFLFKIPNDPRETRVGRMLRQIGLDELPQIINVVRGEMSLVGPRPLPVLDVREGDITESQLLADWRLRQTAVPGITGWWQMRAQNKMSFTEMVALDVYSIKHASVALDIFVLFLTARAMIIGAWYGLGGLLRLIFHKKTTPYGERR